MAFTSGRGGAGSDNHHSIRLNVNGQVRTRYLYDLPGDDYEKNKGDLWKIHIENTFGFYCVKPDQIKSISLVAGSDDAWEVSSVATFVSFDNNGRNWKLLSANFDAYRRLDTDDFRQREFKLTIRRCK